VNITIPIYVQSHRDTYLVRPLFFPHPIQQHEKLERVLHLLAGELRKLLREQGKALRHDELAAWTFCPELDYHRLDLVMELRKRLARGRFFFVVFRTLGRRVAFTPSIPDVWFELARGEDLRDRANEVLTAYFREREKEEEDDFTPPERLALEGTAWITTLDLDIYPAQKIKPDEEERRASLGGDEENLDGERELFRIARCLDQLYPDDLDRILLRDREIEELTRLLEAPDRRPVLLLGPSLVGKTALLHEYVWRTVSTRKEPHKVVNYTWLLSPQRLISGMSFVGQWEKRLLAIIIESRRKEHILYFDDFLGLYYAGRTSQSDLCAADVLKPYIERREVRLIVEMTPEAFRVLRERDRGFADLFHVLPLQEPSGRDVLRILIEVQRQLEMQHRCRFDLDVLSTVLDLQRRYVRHLSFPGKAAMFLRRIAVKNRRFAIERDNVLQEFHLQSGLSLTFLDNREKLAAAEVIKRMENQVIGQPYALQACAEVVSIAKARLNDPERPLASFLFLGPTGVGKTQCAKALATYLFGEADKLLRFDMNEYTEPGAAARLVGTFFQPEGLLTAAIRRQPFAVVLFDEIEKANPEVFDLLLQVLGEGRLTDALGRTADFCNALIILTSNLGVREASASLGYGSRNGHNRDAYTKAAERFFRPEFFNRLDRIVAFERLTRDDVGRIAQLLMRDLFRREGLVRRKCLLRVEGQALDRIIDEGFDPILGARALKRALERQLAQPVAVRLAAGLPEGLTVIHVFQRGEFPRGEGLGVDVRAIEQASPIPAHGGAEPLLANRPLFIEKARVALHRLETRFAPMRPHGEITATSLEGEHLLYFSVQEELHRLNEHIRDMDDRLQAEKRASQTISGYAVSPVARSRRAGSLRSAKMEYDKLGSVLRELAAAQDICQYLEDVASDARAVQEFDESWNDPLGDLALAELLAACCLNPRPERVLVYLWSAGEPGLTQLTRNLAHVFSVNLRLECEDLELPEGTPGKAFVLQGLTAWELARIEEGTHLMLPRHGSLNAVQVHVWPVPAVGDPVAMVLAKVEERRLWQERLSRGTATVEDDPLPLRPVLRIYNEDGSIVDLRTGLVGHYTQLFIVATLPLPPELLSQS
jgi:ATP-dependent Clp protease ATP-binding subunit ClpA